MELSGQLINLNLTLDGGPVALQIRLDPALFSHNVIFGQLKEGKLYEEALSSLVLRVLGPGDAFIDIGAHIGFFSMLAANLISKGGKVISVEPDLDNIARLEEHRDLNTPGNMEIINAIACDEPGEREFYINADNDGGHALWDPGAHEFNKKSAANPQIETKQAVTIDQIMSDKGLDQVKLIKIDTEGAEPLVLDGGRKALSEGRLRFVVCELNGFGLQQMGFSQEILREKMAGYGYQCFLLNDNGSLPRLVPDGVQIVGKYIPNVLFAKLEDLKEFWPVINTD